MLNKLNKRKIEYFFLWDNCTLFSAHLHCEFDKNANSSYVGVSENDLILRKFVEQQIGVCVFSA